MRFSKPYFNPDAGAGTQGGGGGATTPPANQPPANAPATPPTTPPTTPDASSEVKGDALTADEKARFDVLKGKYNITYFGEDGKTPLTPDQLKAYKETEAKVNQILEKPEDQRTAEDLKFLADNTEPDGPVPSVYDKVNELRERTYDIDYGDIDPLSPEGIVLREEHIEKTAIDEFENALKTKLPRAYQFMLHVQHGGKEEDFFKPENQDFRSIKLDKGQKGQQERLVRTALALKGNSPTIIDTLITSLKDSDKLFEVAEQELQALQQQQVQREQERSQKAAALKAQEEKDLSDLGNAFDTALKKGIDGIVIPEKDRKGFNEFFSQQIDYHNGQIYRVQTLNTKDLNKVLKAMYFEFKGGDLGGLVDRKAASKQAIKIKGAIKPTVTPKATSNGKPFLPMSQV
jgi:hypothetical protein